MFNRPKKKTRSPRLNQEQNKKKRKEIRSNNSSESKYFTGTVHWGCVTLDQTRFSLTRAAVLGRPREYTGALVAGFVKHLDTKRKKSDWWSTKYPPHCLPLWRAVERSSHPRQCSRTYLDTHSTAAVRQNKPKLPDTILSLLWIVSIVVWEVSLMSCWERADCARRPNGWTGVPLSPAAAGIYAEGCDETETADGLRMWRILDGLGLEPGYSTTHTISSLYRRE